MRPFPQVDGREIKRFRSSRFMSQSRLARRLGVSQTSVSRMESNGVSTISKAVARRFCRILWIQRVSPNSRIRPSCPTLRLSFSCWVGFVRTFISLSKMIPRSEGRWRWRRKALNLIDQQADIAAVSKPWRFKGLTLSGNRAPRYFTRESSEYDNTIN
jgi:transcriptional regulator with XRE-family HTH domain